jgi:hypothetical protein
MSDVQQKWYDKTWLVVLLCLLIVPVGIYGVWKSETRPQGTKIILTVIFGALTILYVVLRVMNPDM